MSKSTIRLKIHSFSSPIINLLSRLWKVPKGIRTHNWGWNSIPFHRELIF
uniref:Uncharacterized protein n=1 Tax=Glycine max TaxID=3847 RepID=C6TJU9_SOYBN|nr:unknown [Glycine max]